MFQSFYWPHVFAFKRCFQCPQYLKIRILGKGLCWFEGFSKNAWIVSHIKTAQIIYENASVNYETAKKTPHIRKYVEVQKHFYLQKWNGVIIGSKLKTIFHVLKEAIVSCPLLFAVTLDEGTSWQTQCYERLVQFLLSFPLFYREAITTVSEG